MFNWEGNGTAKANSNVFSQNNFVLALLIWTTLSKRLMQHLSSILLPPSPSSPMFSGGVRLAQDLRLISSHTDQRHTTDMSNLDVTLAYSE